MKDYKPEDLKFDTEQFMRSEFGKYVMQTLEEKYEGQLSNAQDTNNPNPIRDLDKATAIKEVITFIKSPLD